MAENAAARIIAQWRANGERWQAAVSKFKAAGLEVWNPALYAFDIFERFVAKFPPEEGAVLAMGLNPGPYGMAQTGVPFTDCRTMRDKLGIPIEIPGRAPEDLILRLKKPTGKWRGTYERSSLGIYRFLEIAWGDYRTAYANWFVGNPCPLLFLDPAAWNVTPADRRLKRFPEIKLLREAAFENFHAVLKPRCIVFLGKDVAEAVGDAARRLAGEDNVIVYPHPARAVPDAWARGLSAELKARRLL